jgi:hypothetical protein
VGFPSAVAVDRSGNLVITLPYAERVRVVAVRPGTFYGQAMTAGDIYTVAGNGLVFESGNEGKRLDAELGSPGGLAVAGSGSGAGNYALFDYGEVRLVAANAGTFFGQAMMPGRIYGLAGNGRPGYTGDGGPATGARVGQPAGGVAFDGAGNLVLADTGNNRIRVVAATTGTFYGQAMTAGDIYTVAGTGAAGFAGDGGPATSAEMRDPLGISIGPSGNLLIADTGNNRVRLVAATSGSYFGQAVTGGDITTVAGTGTAGFRGDSGQAAAAELSSPQATGVDGSGNLLIADTGNGRVREVSGSPPEPSP